MEADEAREDENKASTKTIDLEDVYDKMALQTGYEHHSKFWREKVAEAEA